VKISKAKLLELIKEQIKTHDAGESQLHPSLQRIQTAAGDQAGSKRRLQQELARLVGPRASEVIVNALPPEAHVTLMAALGI